ncbi:MAG: rhomboid family intramembrane serine protease [Gemmatimonadota bacterium]|jgi:membrane associated rhomboid family serine protease
MFPLSDDNPTLRTPVVTIGILALLGLAWVVLQGAGLAELPLVTSVCNLGLVPGELTRMAPLGQAVPLGEGLACVVDREAVNWLTPVTTLFLHGSWGHLLGNAWFLWVFGNNVEDSMGRARFTGFYLLCGLAASATHVAVDPSSPVPTVGASGAISGVMGAYLVLYPQIRVRTYVPPIFFVNLRAWMVLVYWFVLQVLGGLPQLMTISPEVSSGTAFWAHVGGFVAGLLLVRPLQDPALVRRRRSLGDARVVFGEP